MPCAGSTRFIEGQVGGKGVGGIGTRGGLACLSDRVPTVDQQVCFLAEPIIGGFVGIELLNLMPAVLRVHQLASAVVRRSENEKMVYGGVRADPDLEPPVKGHCDR